MAKKVGIPRGLFFYRFFPLWKAFFEELGAEIAISDRTTKKILDDGVRSCVNEACFPVKLYHGHVINLKDKADFLFIPRFTSISAGEYICPKFGGLPDMVRNTVKGLPEIIDVEVNLVKSRRNAYKAAMAAGMRFCGSRKAVEKAFGLALESYRHYRNAVKKGVLPCDIRIERRGYCNNYTYDASSCIFCPSGLNIAVIGHAYNLYDNYANMNLLGKLKKAGANIATIDAIDGRIMAEKACALPKRMFWDFGRRAAGGTLHMLEEKQIDGVIYVMSFGCGIDSFVCDIAKRLVKRHGDIPFIVLTIDEHSGEAGIDTRLEAFIDMIGRARKADY